MDSSVAPLAPHALMKGFTMTTITPEAVEEPRSRTGRFFLVWAVSLGAAIFLSVAGASVTPLTSLWAAEGSPPATAPVDPGTPVEPGVTAPEPSAPASADVCATGTSSLTVRVCTAAAALGWTLTSTAAEITDGAQLTASVMTEEGPLPPLGVGERLSAPSIPDRSSVVFVHERDGHMLATVEALPAQSTASLADEIRTSLGVTEIWFFDGGGAVDGPSISFGPGWTVLTDYDPARAVGASVKAGWATLTVERSGPDTGTVYAVS